MRKFRHFHTFGDRLLSLSRRPFDASTAARRRTAARRCFAKARRTRLERWALGLAWALSPKRRCAACRTSRGCASTNSWRPITPCPIPSARWTIRRALPASCTSSRCRLARRLSARALSAGAYRAAEMVVAAAALGAVFQELPYLRTIWRRQMRQDRYTVTFDRDFEGVIAACAGRRAGPLAPHLDHAAHHARLCRSVRRRPRAFVRSLEQGGRTGRRRLWRRLSAAPSPASRNSRTSRTPRRSAWPFSTGIWPTGAIRFYDGKLIGPLWTSLGFREIPRPEFLARLAEALRLPRQDWPLAGRNRSGNRVALAAAIERRLLQAVIDHVSHQRDFRNPPADA